jgi:beta-galactosidase/beta-glucuronidase
LNSLLVLVCGTPALVPVKNLNCIFTRVQWPQDKRVLDYCDQHGMLIQTEIPAWGPDTFEGMKAEPDTDIMQNALEMTPKGSTPILA